MAAWDCSLLSGLDFHDILALAGGFKPFSAGRGLVSLSWGCGVLHDVVSLGVSPP